MNQQYPPSAPNEFGPFQHPAPKKSHRVRNTLAVIGGVFAGLITLLFIIGSTVDAPATNAAADNPAVTIPGPTVTVTAGPLPAVTVTAPAKPAVTVTAAPKPAVTVTQKPAAPPAVPTTIDEDGTYQVGKEIKPGTYKATCSDFGYWARLSSFEGSDIIDNELVANGGRMLVTIKKTDKGFESRGCAPWTLVK